MAVLKMIDDPEIIKASASLIFEDEGEKFSPEYVQSYNANLKASKNKLGTFALKYRKKGWFSLIATIICSVLISLLLGGFSSESSVFVIAMIMVLSILRTISVVGIFVWIIVWFAYWLAPLQHCSFCNALYARVVVFEKKIPGTVSHATEGRTISHNIKNNQGKVIGSIDEEVDVNVMRVNYYTVYQCKKCKQLKVEIIRKQFDA